MKLTSLGLLLLSQWLLVLLVALSIWLKGGGLLTG